MMSLFVILNRERAHLRSSIIFSSVSATPFGIPQLPDVYKIDASPLFQKETTDLIAHKTTAFLIRD